MPIQTKTQPLYPIPDVAQMIPVALSARYVIVADTETTGFGQYDDITEIGAVKLDVETGKIIDKFSTFVHLKIMKKVSKKIEELTGITTEMLEDAPRIEEVMAAFEKFVGADPIIFHNATFDWRMLNKSMQLIGRTLTNQVICTYRLFKYLHPGLPSNLKDVTAYYGKEIEGHHRAVVDCRWTAACYMKMREELRNRDHLPNSSLFSVESAQVQDLTAQDLKNCIVFHIGGWKKGDKNRIYCTTSLADFYYDINQHVWNVSENKVKKNLDINALVNVVLGKVNMDLETFVATYAAA